MRHHYHVTLEVDLNEPALVPAAFDLLRLNARACHLSDVENIFIHLTIEVGGKAHEREVEELRERLGALWLGDVTDVTIKEPRQAEADAA